jgi:hypothetical protein
MEGSKGKERAVGKHGKVGKLEKGGSPPAGLASEAIERKDPSYFIYRPCKRSKGIKMGDIYVHIVLYSSHKFIYCC